MSTTPDPLRENRVAAFSISPSLLRVLLGLPEGIRVERVFAEHDPQRIRVIVSGSHLPAQPPDCYTPDMEGSWTIHQKVIDGQIWVRWDWMPTL